MRRSSSLSLAYFLTLTFAFVALVGEQVVIAQGKKPGECDDVPAARSALGLERPPAERSVSVFQRQSPPTLAPFPQTRSNPDPPRPPRSLFDPPSQPWSIYDPRFGPRPPLAPLDSSLEPQRQPLEIGPLATSEFPGASRQRIATVDLAAPTEGAGGTASFTVNLTGINGTLYTACTQDGRTIYTGNNPGELCLKLNQEVEGRGVSIIKIQPEGSDTKSHDALLTTLASRMRRVNPNISVLLSSPGASLTESSTEPKLVPHKRLYKAIFKIERAGETGVLTFSNAVRERLNYFLLMLRSRMFSDLRYMSVEEVIRKARADLQRLHPGTDIAVEFTSEAGASHWVRITPLQRLRELWMRS